jgi:hypothetical protein
MVKVSVLVALPEMYALEVAKAIPYQVVEAYRVERC